VSTGPAVARNAARRYPEATKPKEKETAVDKFIDYRAPGRVDEERARIEAELKARKFGVLHTHDVKKTLESKGVAFGTELYILDVCNPVLAKQALEGTQNRIAPLLPCSVAVWQDGDYVAARFLRPTALAAFLPDEKGLDRLAPDAEAAIDAAVRAGLGVK
jgi:uncharacterized protein (DUF302 family)